MALAVTVREVLYIHSYARSAYERLVGVTRSAQQAQNVVALLLWFDQGSHRVMSLLQDMSSGALEHLVLEATSIINCLRIRNLVGPPTPLISALCQDSRMDDPGFFVYNQDLIVRGVVDILDGVGALVFNDRLYHLLRRYQTGLVGRIQDLEAPYTGLPVTVPEDCRSMFVTFSKGQPVEREDIFCYFRETWGDCIVRVLMEKTTGGAQPMYGRIIFKSEAFVSLALNGDERVTIFIGGREIWLRKYIPRNGHGNN